MSEIFDSNIIIDFLNGSTAAEQAITASPNWSISTITWIEVMTGIRSASEDERARVFLCEFETLPLSPAVAEETVRVRREERLKLPDAIIWATALVHGLVLVTRNTRDFPEDHPSIRVPYRL